MTDINISKALNHACMRKRLKKCHLELSNIQIPYGSIWVVYVESKVLNLSSCHGISLHVKTRSDITTPHHPS